MPVNCPREKTKSPSDEAEVLHNSKTPLHRRFLFNRGATNRVSEDSMEKYIMLSVPRTTLLVMAREVARPGLNVGSSLREEWSYIAQRPVSFGI